MAEGSEVEKAEKDLEKEITCIICHEHYTDPKVLPCCHYYCKECISKLSLKAGGANKPFPCPECRKDTILPEGGVDSLPTAFFINRMKAIHSKLEQAPVKQVSETCEICFDDKPEAFCQQCEKYICDDCVKSHREMKALCKHEVNLIEKGDGKDAAFREPSLPACEKHVEQPLKYYCYDCNCLICDSCATTEHKDHHHQLLKVAALDIKKRLAEQMQPLETFGENLTQAVKNVQATKSDVTTQGDAVIEYIESSFDEIYKIVRSRKQSLLAEATTKVVKKLKNLSVQEKRLSSANVAVHTVLEFANQYLKHSGDDDLMCMHTDIQSRLEKAHKEEQKDDKCLDPVEEADIEVEISCIEKVKEFCETEAKISRRTLECVVTGKGVECAEVNNMSEFQVTLVRPAVQVKRDLVVECDLKSLKTGSIKKCEVSQVKCNEYRVHYLPTIKGHPLVEWSTCDRQSFPCVRIYSPFTNGWGSSTCHSC